MCHAIRRGWFPNGVPRNTTLSLVIRDTWPSRFQKLAKKLQSGKGHSHLQRSIQSLQSEVTGTAGGCRQRLQTKITDRGRRQKERETERQRDRDRGVTVRSTREGGAELEEVLRVQQALTAVLLCSDTPRAIAAGMDNVEELLHEVARRLVAWAEPTLAPRAGKSTQESRMVAQCNFFENDEDETSFRQSLPLTLRQAETAKRQELNRRQYAELHGRDEWEHA